MVEVLARLDGRQPDFDDYQEARGSLEALLGAMRGMSGRRSSGSARSSRGWPTSSSRCMRRDVRADDDPGIGQEERDPLALHRAGGLPRAAGNGRGSRAAASRGADRTRGRDAATGSSSSDNIVGNSSPLGGPLAAAIEAFVEEWSRRRAASARAAWLYRQPLVSQGVPRLRRVWLLPAARDVDLRDGAADPCTRRTDRDRRSRVSLRSSTASFHSSYWHRVRGTRMACVAIRRVK